MSTKNMTRRRFLARAAAFAGMATVGSLAAACGATPTPEVIEKVVTQVVEKEITKIVAGTPVKEVVKETVVVEKPVTTVVEKEVTTVVEVPAAAEKITLRVQTLGGVRGEKAYKFARMYEQLKPNMTLKNEDLAWGDTLLKQELLYGTGDLWDICYGHSSYAWTGMYKGWYAPIDDLLAATDAVPNYDDFFVAGVENAKYEGRTHAILDFIVPGAGQFVMFNRPLFEAAGIPVPERGISMLELAEIGRSMTDKAQGVFGFQNCGNSILRTENNTRTWGNPDYGRDGDTRSWIVSADNKEFRYANNDLVKEYFTTWLLPLVEEGVHPTAEDQIEGGLFWGGKCAMWQYHQGGPNRTKLRVKWDWNMADYIPLPPGPDGRIGTSQESQNWYVGGLTMYPEQALNVIGFFTGREAGLFEILEAESGYSARYSVWVDPAVLEYSPVYADGAELLNTIVEPGAFPWNLRYAEFNDAFNNLHQPLAEGQVPWDEQAPVLQRECQAVFDMPMIEK